MSERDPAPPAPGLYFVATPIGTARDITLRALDMLRSADVLAAEDTRNTRKLMEIHGIPLAGRPLVAYHDHNGARVRPKLLARLADGASLAYVSDAGTPLVADPGYHLAREAIAAGHPVHSVPGPSALLAALTVAGLPTDRFFFAGFPPAKAGARRRYFEEMKEVPGTLVFFEAARRCSAIVREMESVLGDREAALCRELTKRFEDVRRGRLSEIAEGLEAYPPRGEVVIVVGRGDPASEAADLDGALLAALETMRVKDAAASVAGALGLPRREVYQRALDLSGAAKEEKDR